MRPFRSRVMAAIVLAVLLLGLLGTVDDAAGFDNRSFPEDPWPGLNNGHRSFPEDPWPGLNP
jgi:hypothetical protein